jgi:MoaA/NifB/PqqE/SkfB family radical SAM enzyme
MNLFSPFKNSKKNPNVSFFDNTNRIARCFYQFKSYTGIFIAALKKGIPLSNLLITRFPLFYSDALEPPIIAIELTNYCDLKCPYCTSPLGLREKGFMSDIVFNKIIIDLIKMKPNRVQLVGNGELTLHPNFGAYISRISQTGKYISIVTNGQWKMKFVAERILNAKIDLLEISIDAGGKEKYEYSRVHGSYDILISNLRHLKILKEHLKSKTLINIRLMVRPSQKKSYRKEISFWKKYADSVIPQFISKINNTEYNQDVFIPVQNSLGSFPKRSLPFKHMEIKYTGEVLMCYYSFFQMGSPGLKIGNVLDSSINELWNSKIMKDYRNAHRLRIKENMPVCQGCPGT